MALSGTVTGGVYDYCNNPCAASCKVDWSAVQDVAANKSTITAIMYVNSQGPTVTNIMMNCTVQGALNPAPRTVAADSVWVEFGRATWEAAHNADGTGGFELSAAFVRATPTANAYYINSGSIATTYFALDTIPRASVLGTISPFNIEDGFSAPVTKYAAAFYDRLELKYGGSVIKTVNGYTSGAPVTLTDAELAALYRLYGTSKTATLTLALTTCTSSAMTTIVGTDSGSATGTAAGTARIRVSGTWRRGLPYIRVSGVWKPALIYSRTGGTWKRGR